MRTINVEGDLNIKYTNRNSSDNGEPFYNCINLENLHIENLGIGYASPSANSSNHRLNLKWSTKLTHESLVDIITNGLYDIASKGCNVQKVCLSQTSYDKLTAEEIAVATAKGWNVVVL